MDNKQRILCLALGRVCPGMTLASPVRAPDGSTLLTAETVLDVTLLEHLFQRNIKAVSVRVPDPRDEATIERELTALRARVETIFRGPGSAARNELRDVVQGYRIESTQ